MQTKPGPHLTLTTAALSPKCDMHGNVYSGWFLCFDKSWLVLPFLNRRALHDLPVCEPVLTVVCEVCTSIVAWHDTELTHRAIPQNLVAMLLLCCCYAMWCMACGMSVSQLITRGCTDLVAAMWMAGGPVGGSTVSQRIQVTGRNQSCATSHLCFTVTITIHWAWSAQTHTMVKFRSNTLRNSFTGPWAHSHTMVKFKSVWSHQKGAVWTKTEKRLS